MTSLCFVRPQPHIREPHVAYGARHAFLVFPVCTHSRRFAQSITNPRPLQISHYKYQYNPAKCVAHLSSVSTLSASRTKGQVLCLRQCIPATTSWAKEPTTAFTASASTTPQTTTPQTQVFSPPKRSSSFSTSAIEMPERERRISSRATYVVAAPTRLWEASPRCTVVFTRVH